MNYYSTNNKSDKISLSQAVIQGLANDNGLFMPEKLPQLDPVFFDQMRDMQFSDIAFEVSRKLFFEDIGEDDLKTIINRAINFDAPIVALTDRIYSLELFHGPTLAFKDFGARFMAELLTYFTKQNEKKITILVATSGDTGSAVAAGFLDNPNTDVVILYPSGKVSFIQEKQITTLGANITALEVKGNFDDCQKLVKTAFLDKDLKTKLNLSSANSINIARLFPQSFYYFYAYSRLPLKQINSEIVFSIPSGNFGNLTAGLFAAKMGLPVSKFIAATNINDTIPAYLKSGLFSPKQSKETISNAMDVGNPSNFARMNEIFSGNPEEFSKLISGYSFTDDQTRAGIKEIFAQFQYTPDPHGAVAYLGLKEYFKEFQDKDITGIFLETAHPAKFIDIVEKEINQKVEIPARLKSCLEKQKKSIVIENNFENFKEFLLK